MSRNDMFEGKGRESGKILLATRYSLLALLAMALMVLIFASPSWAATKTWDGGGSTNDWSDAANWSGDTAPTPADTAVFDGTSTKDATIDVAIAVDAFNINSGYTGEITQAPGAAVTTGAYTQSVGTFTGGNGDIDINGNFNLSGGAFTASSGSTFFGRQFVRGASGTFNHNDGTVVWDGVSVDNFINAPLTLNNFTINKNDNEFFTLFGGNAIAVAGTLTLTDGRFLSGSAIEAQDAVNWGADFDGGDGPLHITAGDGQPRTITLDAGMKLLPITLNAPNATVNTTGAGALAWKNLTLQAGAIEQGGVTFDFGGNRSYTQSGGAFTGSSSPINGLGAFTQSGGTFTGGSGDVDINGNFALSGGTFTASSGTTFFAGQFASDAPGGTFNHNGGTGVLDGSGSFDNRFNSTTFNNLTFDKSGGATVFLNSTVNAAGTLTLSDGFARNGTIEARGAVSVGADFDGGETAINVTGSGNQIYTNDGGANPTRTWTINKPSGTVTLASNLDISNANFGSGLTDLNLTNGTITTGNFTVNAGLRTINRTEGHIIGNLQRSFTATGSKKFDVGTANGYSPVNVNVTTLTTNPSSLTVGAKQGAHPQLDADSSLRRFWTLTETGDLTATLTFDYLQTDVHGNEDDYRVARISSGAPTFLDPPQATVDTANDRATVTGVSEFSDWTLGDPAAPPPPLAINPTFANVASGASEDFTVIGGAGPFTFSLPTNNSGGEIDASTGLYTAGATASVTDTVRVTDSTDASADATVNVLPADANPSISGRLTDADGAPLADVEVRLSGDRESSTLTDANGDYTFDDLPSGGDFTVRPASQLFTFDPSERDFADLTASRNAQDFTGTRVFRISGRVTSLFEGATFPLDGVRVTLGGEESRAAQTDADGKYIFNAVAPQTGDYIVTAAKEGFIVSPSSVTIPGTLTSDEVADFEAEAAGPLDGRIAFLGGSSYFQIQAMNADGGGQVGLSRRLEQLPNEPPAIQGNRYFHASDPAFSRDGGRIVFSHIHIGRTAGDPLIRTVGEIFTMNADGSEQTQLTENPLNFSSDRHPAFSPDNGEIVFVKAQPVGDIASDELFTMNADGSGQTEVSINAPDVLRKIRGTDWAPDGTRIVFSMSFFDESPGCEGCDADVYSITPGGSDLTRLTSGSDDDFSPSFSPDGSRIAFLRRVSNTGDNQFAVFVMDADGSNPTQIAPAAAGGDGPTWSPDGTKLAFTRQSADPLTQELMVVNADGSDLFVVTSGKIVQPSWSRAARAPTPAGSDVEARSGATTVTFDGVSASGNTTVTPVPPGSAGEPTPGFSLGRFGAFEISTTASFTPPIEVCFDLSSFGLGSTTFDSIALLHNEGGTLVDSTTSRDFPTRTICGTVDSLSPFALAEVADDARPAITGLVRDADGEPMSGVSVSLTGAQSREATTGIDGLFSFVNLDADGDYNVEPRKLGFLFAEPEKGFDDLSGDKSVVFAATAANFRIGGRVVDGDGDGVSGARIDLEGAARATQLTDANGEYSFTNLPAGGLYGVTASRDGSTFDPPERVVENLTSDHTSANFTVAAISVNNPPTISEISDQQIDENASTGALDFTVGDAESDASVLTAEGVSSNQALVPDANIEFGGSGAQRTVEVRPAADRFGQTTITLKVEDGDGGEATETFTATVNEVGDPTATTLTLNAKPGSVKRGKSVALSGRLVEVNGQAVAGERVVVQRKIGKAPYKNFRTLTTKANGTFSLKFKPAKTAFYRVVFVGSEADGLEASASPAKKIVVKPAKKKKKR